VDEKRTDLKAALRDLAGEDAGDSGRHVGLKRLIAYRQGTLPAAEREEVQEHLSLCPRCTGLLLELRDFEAAAARGDVGPEHLRQEAWDSLVRRLPGEIPVRPIAGAARREAQQRRRFPRFAAAAAALLLAVLGLMLWAAITVLQEHQRLTRLERRQEERDAALAGLQSSLAAAERQLDAARGQLRELERTAPAGRGQPAPRVDELASEVAELTSAVAELRRTAQTLERRDQIARTSRGIEVSAAPLFALRGQAPKHLRTGGEVNSVRIPPHEDRFTVTLGLAARPAYDEYRLELMDREGKLLWGGRRPGRSLLGDDGTEVSVSGLGPGLYRLRIEGVHPDRSELLAEYLLQVEP
jgi:Putative zinc-finger